MRKLLISVLILILFAGLVMMAVSGIKIGNFQIPSIYQIIDEALILRLIRTGTHSDLF